MKKTLSKITTIAFAAASIFAALTFTACSNSSGGVPYIPTNIGSNSGTGTTQGGSDGNTGGGNNGGQQNGGAQGQQDFIPESYYYYQMAVDDTAQVEDIISLPNYLTVAQKIQEVESGQDVVYANGSNIMAQAVGTATVKILINKDSSFDPQTNTYGITYETRIVVTVVAKSSQGEGSGGGSQDTSTSEGLKAFLVGTWTCSDNGFSGTITLNSDGSGHIDVTRSNGDVIHNKDFTWTAYTSKILKISGTNEGALDGEHSLTTAANSFTMNGYLAFGMPSQTTWTKQ